MLHVRNAACLRLVRLGVLVRNVWTKKTSKWLLLSQVCLDVQDVSEVSKRNMSSTR
jgi:hypothetical protein